MSRRVPFWQYDVFTTTAFGGNTLGVYPEADALSDAEMQSLAREMNCPETTFVLPPESADANARVRIFTPAIEIPFAGHPIVGTAWALVEQGHLEPLGGGIRFEVGLTERRVLPIEVVREEGAVRPVTMTQGAPEVGPALAEKDWASVLAALGVDWDAMDDALPIARSTTGLPFLMVPLTSADAIAALRPDMGPLADALAALDCAGAYVFTLDGATATARSFCPGAGVPEDPATGSAAGALGAFLSAQGATQPVDGVRTLTIAQGASMNRPSEIAVLVDEHEGRPRVRVRGTAVCTLMGEALVPESE